MAKNIFEQMMIALSTINQNIVDLSEELATLRGEVEVIQASILPAPIPTEQEGEDSVGRTKKK